MTGDEVAPDDQIRFAVVGREIDAVGPAIADLLEDLAEGALVERFAVHDNAVHVKNDCFKSFHSHHWKLPALSEDLQNPEPRKLCQRGAGSALVGGHRRPSRKTKSNGRSTR